jgi:mxaL protein
VKLAARLRRSFDPGAWPLMVAPALLALAAWMPDVNLPRNTYHYMATFDITQSMNVEDMTHDGVPVSRLALARLAMREALRELPCGSKVGWSIFADYRSFALLLPIEVCSNYDVLLSTLAGIDGRLRWANASNVGRGVYWSLRNANDIVDTDIVFFTDGQEAPPLRPGQLPMPTLPQGQSSGLLVGVGGELPSKIPRTGDDGKFIGYWGADEVVQVAGLAEGQSHEHLSALREDYLVSLARQSALGYVRLDTPATLQRALLAPSLAHRAPAPTSLRAIPASLALLLLAWHFWPDMRRGHFGTWLARRRAGT